MLVHDTDNLVMTDSYINIKAIIMTFFDNNENDEPNCRKITGIMLKCYIDELQFYFLYHINIILYST